MEEGVNIAYNAERENIFVRLYRVAVQKVPWYVWWISPGLAMLAFVTMPPFIWLIWMTFYKISLLPTEPDLYIGGANYIHMFTDPKVLEGWGRLGYYVVLSMALQMGIGIGMAMLMNKSKHEDLLMVIYLVPMMFAPVAVGYVWQVLMHSSYGIYHWLLETLRIIPPRSPSLFGDPRTALWMIIGMDTWEWTPLVIMIVLAGLKTVPKSVVEAARIDGASRWQVFRDVTIPFISPAVLIALLLRFMDNIRFTDKILSTTMGGPADATKTLSVYIYQVSFREFDLGYAATIGFSLLVVTIIISMILTNIFSKYLTARR